MKIRENSEKFRGPPSDPIQGKWGFTNTATINKGLTRQLQIKVKTATTNNRLTQQQQIKI